MTMAAEPDESRVEELFPAPGGGRFLAVYEDRADGQALLLSADGRLERALVDLPIVAWDVRFVWSPDGHRLAAGGGAGSSVLIYDPETGASNLSIPVGCQVDVLAWGPRGIFVGCDDASIRQVDPVSGLVRSFVEVAGSENISSIVVSPDGRLLAAEGSGVGVTDGVLVWDVESGALLARMYPGHGNVDFLAFSPAGDRVTSGHADGTVRTWDLRDLRTPGVGLLAEWLNRLGLRFHGARTEQDPAWSAAE